MFNLSDRSSFRTVITKNPIRKENPLLVVRCLGIDVGLVRYTTGSFLDGLIRYHGVWLKVEIYTCHGFAFASSHRDICSLKSRDGPIMLDKTAPRQYLLNLVPYLFVASFVSSSWEAGAKLAQPTHPRIRLCCPSTKARRPDVFESKLSWCYFGGRNDTDRLSRGHRQAMISETPQKCEERS